MPYVLHKPLLVFLYGLEIYPRNHEIEKLVCPKELAGIAVQFNFERAQAEFSDIVTLFAEKKASHVELQKTYRKFNSAERLIDVLSRY